MEDAESCTNSNADWCEDWSTDWKVPGLPVDVFTNLSIWYNTSSGVVCMDGENGGDCQPYYKNLNITSLEIIMFEWWTGAAYYVEEIKLSTFTLLAPPSATAASAAAAVRWVVHRAHSLQNGRRPLGRLRPESDHLDLPAYRATVPSSEQCGPAGHRGNGHLVLAYGCRRPGSPAASPFGA